MVVVINPSGSIMLGRMATLPLAFVEWCYVFWYAKRVPSFSRSRWTKVAAGAVSICVIAGVLVGQCSAYAWGAHTKVLNDPFLTTVILIESLVSAGILFRVLIDQRKRNL